MARFLSRRGPARPNGCCSGCGSHSAEKAGSVGAVRDGPRVPHYVGHSSAIARTLAVVISRRRPIFPTSVSDWALVGAFSTELLSSVI